MKTQGFERRFSQNLAPVSLVKPQNLYFAYISNLFSKPYLAGLRLTLAKLIQRLQSWEAHLVQGDTHRLRRDIFDSYEFTRISDIVVIAVAHSPKYR